MLRKRKNLFARNLFILSLFQLFALSSFAQFSISGTITDEKGDGLQGATVMLKNTNLRTIVGTNGKYLFTNLKDSGKYTLVVSFLGYETSEKTIDLQKNEEVNFTLKPLSIMTDEVIVSAIRAGSKTPVAVSNISSEDIKKNNTGQDIPYQLNMLPSVVVSSEAGAGIGNTSMRIRGTDATRINVTVNGIPLNDSESQGVYWVNMPDFASSVDNIQVQRGVGTSTNGVAAFGGTVNFKTKTINKQPYAEIASTAGSFSTFKNTFKAGTGLIKEKFSFDARYSTLNSDGFIDRAFCEHNSLFMSGNYYGGKSLIKFNIIHGNQRTGISWWGNDNIEKNGRTYNPAGKYEDDNGNTQFYDNQTDNYVQTHYQLFYSYEFNYFLFLNTALHYTRGNGYYEQYKENEKYKSYNIQTPIHGTDTVKTTDLIRQKKMSNDFYGATASLKYIIKNIDAVIGVAWNKYDGDHFGDVIWTKNGEIANDYEWYRNNGTKTDFNVFAKLNYEINENLNIYGDVQYRNINYKMTGKDDDLVSLEQEHNFDFFNPKIGLFYTINNKNNIYVSFATANREPTRANFKEAKGDPNAYPKAETLFDYELGYEYRGNKTSAGVNFYFMDYKDQLVPTGEKSSVGYDIMTNVAKSYRAGIELIAGVQILPKLRWDINLTLSRNKIENFIDHIVELDKNWYPTSRIAKVEELGTTDISFSPNIIGSSMISWKVFKNFNASFTTKYVGEQYIDNTSNKDRKLDAYLVNNLRLQYVIKTKYIKEMGFSLQVNNILDAEYKNNAYGSHGIPEKQSEVSNWIAYFPQAGINFLAGINLKF